MDFPPIKDSPINEIGFFKRTWVAFFTGLKDSIASSDEAIDLNTTHRTSSGVDHSDVVLNNSHRVSDGKSHSDVVLNNAKVTNVTTNLTTTQTTTTVDVVSSDGTDATLPQAIAGGNAGVLSGADKNNIDLNTLKVTNVSTDLTTTQTTTTVDVVSSDGTDATLPQAISGGNAGVLSGADKASIDTSITHVTSNGSDHTYINQSVTTTATPTFGATTINGDVTITGQCLAASANAIQVYRQTNQTGIVTGTWTQIELTNETLDQESDFNTTTWRFTPQEARWYWCFAQVRWTTSVDATDIAIRIRKNGSTTMAQSRDHASYNGTPTTNTGQLIQFNGTTDYITVEARQNSGSNKNIDGGASNTFLTTFRIST